MNSTQNEIDEANSSHAQEAEEQEELKLAEGIWHYSGGMLDNEAFKAKLFSFASKLRALDAAEIASLKAQLAFALALTSAVELAAPTYKKENL